MPSVTGGVAQLGERLLCKQEVIGSIPFTSTILRRAPGAFCGMSSEADEAKEERVSEVTGSTRLDREKQTIRRSAKAGVCDL